MNKIFTLEDALKKIEELEIENTKLREQLERYKNYDFGGRRKHDAKWQTSYQSFVQLYEQGMSIVEIVKQSDFSRRTCYRYKAHYDAIKQKREGH